MRSRLLTLLLTCLPSGAFGADEALFQRVSPIIRERCLSCHNSTKKRGGLDLSNDRGLRKGSDSGPVLGESDEKKSLLLRVISGPDASMPKTGPKLTGQEVEFIRRWIANGARWPNTVVLKESARPASGDWWSLQPLKRPRVPEPKDPVGVRTPIDSFVRDMLEKKGLVPSREADRATLLRRMTFDMHGLPPTPEEIAAFVNDTRSDAVERVVDRLLASPRYGERWGRHWLDVVHYGDTHGYDKDKRRDFAWRYRDYVIHAFNADKPYERFIKEQLAGDIICPDDPDGVAATGFIAAGPWDFVGHVELREGTVDKEKTRLLDRDDMVTTTGTTFLSLTVGCARCHDHKFDPITQRDYYRLQAVFAGVDRGDRSRPFEAAELARKHRLDAENQHLQKQAAELRARVAALTSPELEKMNHELRDAKSQLDALPRGPTASSPTNGYHSAIMSSANAVKWVQVDLGTSRAVDEIWLIPARPTDFPDTPGFGFPIRFRVETSDNSDFRSPHLLAEYTAADYPNPGDEPVRIRADGASARFVRVTATRLWRRTGDYVFALAELQVVSQGVNVACGKPVTALDSIEAGRWSVRNLVDGFTSRGQLPDAGDVKAIAAYRARLDLLGRVRHIEKEQKEKADALIDSDLRGALRSNEDRIKAVAAETTAIAARAKVYAVRSIRPRPIHVLYRGDVEQPRELVDAGAPACARSLDTDFKLSDPDNEGARRIALANWIADTENPLTWRSIVNRVWHYHFGRGLVDTPSDFGRNGSQPTHPELLDWLACEFRDHGGSFKHLHRLILTSAVYRQASASEPAAAKIDADNRYLWRMNRTRLDAEAIRDTVLSVSGRLDLATGGPGFELFRFKDDHSPIYDHSALEKIHDPATYRRTVYRFTVRSVPNPLLDTLDCADPNINTPVRNTTLTALQALALLNDPFLVRQAEYFAARVHDAGDLPAQIERAYRLALGRSPTLDERTALTEYAAKHGMANACRVLFNLNEFVFID